MALAARRAGHDWQIRRCSSVSIAEGAATGSKGFVVTQQTTSTLAHGPRHLKRMVISDSHHPRKIKPLSSKTTFTKTPTRSPRITYTHTYSIEKPTTSRTQHSVYQRKNHSSHFHFSTTRITRTCGATYGVAPATLRRGPGSCARMTGTELANELLAEWIKEKASKAAPGDVIAAKMCSPAELHPPAG